MQKINRKLWGKHELQFPVTQEIAYLIGPNGTGKTYLLGHLEDYFTEKGEQVLYFEDDRYFTHPPKDVLTLFQQQSLVSFSFLAKYEIDVEQLFLEREYMQPIYRGKIQLVNFLYSILTQTQECIVIIDEPERNLDILTQKTLVEDLRLLPHVKQVIVATHSPMIFSDFELGVDIKQCLLD